MSQTGNVRKSVELGEAERTIIDDGSSLIRFSAGVRLSQSIQMAHNEDKKRNSAFERKKKEHQMR